jgi:hypothetical protein
MIPEYSTHFSPLSDDTNLLPPPSLLLGMLLLLVVHAEVVQVHAQVVQVLKVIWLAMARTSVFFYGWYFFLGFVPLTRADESNLQWLP